MTWPQATDYNAAVQNPQVCFREDDLRQGQVVGDLFGLPRPHAGNFADVYQIQCGDGQSWAVKCFTRPVSGLRQRYQAISDHLLQAQRAFMVEFRYLEEGICVRGQWYPIVKMRWVEGFTLNEFIRDHLDKPALLDRLAQLWLRLGQELRDAQMAHGDLQHGNVLLVPGSRSTSLALKLIDYDGMFVPALADTPSGEVGHPNYQHPQRLREGAYDREVDRFAHLLIYTALRCLSAARPDLWQRCDNQENLLFREDDFRRPRESRLLHELWGLKDRDARDLMGHLLLASQGPLLVVPSLAELVDEKVVRPLTGSEEAQVHALLGDAPVMARKSRLVMAAPVVPAVAAAIEVRPDPVAVLVAAPAEDAVAETVPLVVPAGPAPPPLPALARAGATPPPVSHFAGAGSAEMALEAGRAVPHAAQASFEVSSLLDPIVSMLSRPLLLGTFAVIALVSFLLVNVLVWTFAKQPPPTPPTVQPPRLLPLPAVTLTGGHKQELVVAVERNDSDETLTIQVDGLPADMLPPNKKPPLLTLAPGQDTVALPLLAPLDFELPRRDVFVSLLQGGQKINEGSFELMVRKVASPRLRQPESIRCKAGTTFLFTAPVDRRDCTETVSVQFDDLPRGVKQHSLPASGSAMPRVELSVPADAKAVERAVVTLTLRVGDVIAGSEVVFFSIDEPSPRPRLRMKDSVSVKAGETVDVLVLVDRYDSKGPVEIRLVISPAGVSADPVVIPADVSFGTLTIKAAADREPEQAMLKAALFADGQKTDEKEITLTVEKPAAVPPLESPRGNLEEPRKVSFTTVDGVKLGGTLYRGSKGKKGACVLLVHDMGHHRREEGWQRLAVALQTQGHTVFTFDFRGHGESKAVDQAFWLSKANHILPAYRKHLKKPPLPDSIDAAAFPAAYSFWLVLDLAAARLYLDRLNDDRKSPVNTGNLFVIGAGEGATLSILWLDSECRRHLAPVLHGQRLPEEPSEGKRVMGAIWLNARTTLGKPPLNVPAPAWVRVLGRDNLIPMVFLYGEKDALSVALADTMLESMKGLANNSSSKRAVAGTAEAGHRLLSADLDTEKLIVQQVAAVLKAGGKDWQDRDIDARLSFWRLPNGKTRPAKEFGWPSLAPVPLDLLGIPLPAVHVKPPP